MKYGFVYIWFDKKHKRYYVGCHWGTENDGYVCSSSWMKQAYKRRSQDFKRRILVTNIQCKIKLYQEEYRYLDMIKEEELGKRYYNLVIRYWEHWSANEQTRLTIGQKISKSKKEYYKNNPRTAEMNAITSKSTSIAMIQYYKDNPRTEETCKKISENNKRLQAEKKIGMHGKTHKEETIQLMKDNNAMNNPEHRAKVKKAKQNIKWLINENKDKKMAVPGTDKWNNLIAIGYMPIRKTINVNL